MLDSPNTLQYPHHQSLIPLAHITTYNRTPLPTGWFVVSCHWWRSVLSLGAVIAIFSGIIFNGEKIVGKNLLSSSCSTLSLYHLVLTFIGILLTFSPMHFLGFNVMPRRIPDFPDYFHSWNFLSSIGSGITFLSFGVLPRDFYSLGKRVIYL